MATFTPALRNIKLFYLFSFTSMFSPCAPFFMIYFAQITGSYTLAMSVWTIRNLTIALLEVPTGILSDKFKRKTVTLLASCCFMISACLYAIANGYLILMLACICDGLYNALISGNDEALIFDSLKENRLQNKYHKVWGNMRFYRTLSYGLSAVLGSIIVWLWGIRQTYYVVVLCSIVMLLLSANLTEPDLLTQKAKDNIFKHFWKSVKYVWKDKKLRYLTLATGLDYGLGYAAYDFVNVFFKQFVPLWVLGALRIFSNLIGSIGSFFSYKISMALGYTKTILTFMGLNYVINFLSVLANCIASPFIKSVDVLISDVAEPAQESLMQNNFTDQQRATMGSVISLFRSCVYGFFSLFIGFMADTFSAYTSLMIIYIACFFILPIYYLGLRSK